MKRRPNYKSRKTIINIILITLLIAMTSTGIYIFTKANDNAEAFSKENIEMPENTQIGSNNEETQQNQEQENVQVNINNNQNTQVNNTTNNPTNNKTNTTQIKDQEVIDIVKETVETGTDGKYLSWKQTSNSIEKITTNVESTEVTIELSANVDKVEINGEITYTIKISSNKELKNVPVKDLIPEMTTFKAVENNGKEILDENGKVVALRWEVDLKEENNYIAEIKFTVTVNEDATGKILNSEAIANGKKIENPVEVSVLSHILFVENGGTEVEDIINKDSKTAIENKEMPTTSKIGYVFEGWYDNENFEGNKVTTLPEEYVAGTTTYYAKWIPATDTKYIVQHHQQNIENDEYTLVDTENLTGTTDEQTSAVAKNYEGFTVKEFAQVAISPDGSTVVDIYYDRNIYTITYKITGNIDATEDFAHSDLKYGQDVTPVEKPTKTGYTFIGWDNEPTTMPNSNVTVEGKYEPNTDTAYTVKHHQQNANDNEYTLADTENLTGTTDELTSAVAKNYEGFTVKTFEQKTIAPDGSTVVDIYYDRNVYTITYNIIGTKFAQDNYAQQEYKYEANVETASEPQVKEGYTFSGWSTIPTTMPNNDVTVEGKYEPNTDTAYTVKHYQQNANDDGYTLVDTENLTGTTDELTNAVAKEYTGFTVKTFEQKTIAPDGSTVVDIYYDRNVYTVNFNANDSEATGETPSQVVKFGEEITLNENRFEKYNYEFRDWNTATDGTGSSYKDKANFQVTQNNIAIVNNNNIELYAQWTLLDAKFDIGSNVNKTIKELVNPQSIEKSNIAPTDLSVCKNVSITSTPIYIWLDEEDTSKVLWYTKDPTPELNENCSNMFRELNIAYEDITKICGTKNVTNMSGMFKRCYKLTTVDVSNFDTSNVTNMSAMFEGCRILPTLDVSNFDTSKVTNMLGMFEECSRLTTLDVSKFDTSNVTNMSNMFKSCSSLTTLNISNFDTSNVKNMNSMFCNCSNLKTLDVSNWNTSKVTNMGEMFAFCSEKLTELDLSNFDTSNVTNMSGMFTCCRILTTIYSSDNFVTEQVKNSTRMFDGCSKLQGGNGTRYSSSKVDKEYARIDKEETPGYFTSKESLETVSQQNEDSTLSSNKQEEMSSFRMVKGNVPTTTITKTETPVTLETVTKVETPVAPMDEEKIKQEEQEEVKQKETTQGNSNNKDDEKTKNVDKTDEIKTTISTETKNSTVTEKETIKE